MSNKELLEYIIKAHGDYWYSAGEYIHLIEKLYNANNLSDMTNQRLRCMKTKLEADRWQIEFELNRVAEEI